MPDGPPPNRRTHRLTTAAMLVVATLAPLGVVNRMFGRNHAARGCRVRSKLAALTLAAGLVLPGALVALTSSTAGAQGSDPLSPTIAQAETFYAEVVANTQQTQQTLYRELFGPFGLVSGAQCLAGDALSGAPLGPWVG